MVVRRRQIDLEGELPESVPRDRGALAAVEALLECYRSPSLPDLPPLHSGVLGYLGYDVVREVEHLPDVPEDQLGVPDAVFSVISELAAYDHWRQRVVLIANAWCPGHDGLSDADLDRRYDEAMARIDSLADAGTHAIDEPAVEPPDRSEPLPEVTSTMGGVAHPRPGAAAQE